MTTANHDVIHFVEKLVRSKTYRTERQSERSQAHPVGEQLYDYVLGWLDSDTEKAVRRHLSGCAVCMDEVLRIQAFERASDEDMVTETIPPDSQHERQFSFDFSQCHQVVEDLIHWVSPTWQPEFAGLTVTAADIAEQKHLFTSQDGDIDIRCSWRIPEESAPGYLEFAWAANIVTAYELWALFIHPETRLILAAICLGEDLEGGKIMSSQDLGFDPSKEQWVVSIMLQEKRL